ncbi:hypothetical protein KI387_035143, partial [Taxus chinensis]
MHRRGISDISSKGTDIRISQQIDHYVSESATSNAALPLLVQRLQVDQDRGYDMIMACDSQIYAIWLGVCNNIDFLSLSYTRHVEDIRQTRAFLAELGNLLQTEIFAKIETIDGLELFDENLVVYVDLELWELHKK